MKKKGHSTNEWEFQGQVNTWLNEEIQRRPGTKLDRATQEPSKLTPKRNDLVVWWDRAAESAFLTIELKTPATPIADPALLADADEKAKRWGAPFFAIWNMRAAELYRTPIGPTAATPAYRLSHWPVNPLVGTVDDWLRPKVADALHRVTQDLLDKAWSIHTTAGGPNIAIEASVFVDRLSRRLGQIRQHIQPALTARAAADRSIRKRLRALAAAQGFLGLVDDIDIAIAGQYAYRLIGQILFYFALRRKQPTLPSLSISAQQELPSAFRPYWDEVRRYDYEALFQQSELDDLVPLPPASQTLVRAFIGELADYDWNSLRDDVLGSIFEQLIPRKEQILLGQFYTPPRVADLVLGFVVEAGASDATLDPGCGSGTFLMRAYDFLKSHGKRSHADVLSLLWGFDISAFATELAAINLFRQDMSAFDNFPRIVQGNFFERRPDEHIPFPPAKLGGQDKVVIDLPLFSGIVGNPPYLRSQNQDDLALWYKAALFNSAAKNSIDAASKTDLFAFFVYKSLEFLKPGGRLGFVTSASWLTADFAIPLQKLLLDRLRIVAIVGSLAESFFSQVDVNTVLLIAERREAVTSPPDHELLRFVTLKRRLDELFPEGSGDYWSSLLAFVDTVEATTTSTENDSVRITVRPALPEKIALENDPTRPRNWSLYLRAPLSYYDIFEAAS